MHAKRAQTNLVRVPGFTQDNRIGDHCNYGQVASSQKTDKNSLNGREMKPRIRDELLMTFLLFTHLQTRSLERMDHAGVSETYIECKVIRLGGCFVERKHNEWIKILLFGIFSLPRNEDWSFGVHSLFNFRFFIENYLNYWQKLQSNVVVVHIINLNFI